MREITCQQITETVRDLCIRANTDLAPDVCRALEKAAETEESPVGRSILRDIGENYRFAREKKLPICQDTGMAVIFADLGQDVHVTGGDFSHAVDEGVARGYTEGKLRLSVVGDPLRRVNTENNTPAIVHLRIVPGDRLTLTVAPKGFGSENMTQLKMFNPSATRDDIIRFAVGCVDSAGSKPCPPVIVGVGLGGTSERAAELAKRALIVPAGEPNGDPFYAGMEAEILRRVNDLGIGPQGLGGRVTALAVHIMICPTHIAGLPCCVNIGCHVTRHATAVL